MYYLRTGDVLSAKRVTLLKPGAWMAISFRQADPDNPRSMFPCHVDELEQLARIHGTFIERVETASDQLARTGIEWTRVIIRLPDDGTGALPVIRHIILKDSKSYIQLALLNKIFPLMPMTRVNNTTRINTGRSRKDVRFEAPGTLFCESAIESSAIPSVSPTLAQALRYSSFNGHADHR